MSTGRSAPREEVVLAGAGEAGAAGPARACRPLRLPAGLSAVGRWMAISHL